MFNLGSAPHRAIAELQPRYGPIVWLKLGSVDTMAVLTSKSAAELFRSHDLAFADRSIVETMTARGYSDGSLALAPYGPRWRVLRRICTVEMFATRRIDDSAAIRRRCVDDMVAWIERDGIGGNSILLGIGGNSILLWKYAFLAAFNMLGNVMMSRDLADAGVLGNIFISDQK